MDGLSGIWSLGFGLAGFVWEFSLGGRFVDIGAMDTEALLFMDFFSYAVLFWI